MSHLRIGLIGCGIVGSAFVELFAQNAESLPERTGTTLQLTHIADRFTDKVSELVANKPCLKDVVVTDKALDLTQNPEIDVIVELMGGKDFAYTVIESALNNNKHVVTANKALLAERGNTLFELAAKKNLALMYEASVAGAIPVVQTLKESLSGNQICRLEGILNGTSNYILSQMTSNGKAFAEALADAQEKGYAEADPTLDIDGFDTAHKLTLLIRLAWGVDYPYEEMPIAGIRHIDSMDIEFARDFGYRIKLLGGAANIDGKIVAGVFPTLVHYTYLLASVGGAYNAVRLEGSASGSLFLHGLGAGGEPTSSAVLGDVIMLARQVHTYNLGYVNPDLPKASIVKPSEAISPYYLRMLVLDKPGILRDITGTLADQNVSIAKANQKGQSESGAVPLTFITYDAPRASIEKAIESMKKLGLLFENTDVVCCPIREK